MPSAIHTRSLLRTSAFSVATLLAGAALLALAGCSGSSKKASVPTALTSRYQTQPLRKVPEYLKDTVLERCDLGSTEPFPISGYGLMSGLHNTGDSFAGTSVRNYMIKQMETHGFGSRQLGMEKLTPEKVLSDPSFAIVRVEGLLPPGARKHQRFDVFVTALDGNNTSSLAHGHLYSTQLKVRGANPQQPGYEINTWATGVGDVFVNPAYALKDASSDGAARASLRQGTILGGGVVQIDRPLTLKLRQPSMALCRAIENRIDQAFQDPATSAAKDDAIIAMYVPEKYGDDWQHFAQVVMHLYFNPTPEFAAIRAKQLVEEAQKPDAPLLDISYAWEAFGPTVVPVIAPLLSSDNPEIAFAAARAAGFLNDSAAQNVLIAMARDSKHPFQLPAVQALAKMPSSPLINQMLRSLLDSDQTLVRIEAYKALAAHDDPAIISRVIARPGADDGFILDIVPSQGKPLIYASASGLPRIAIIGNRPRVNMPVLFMAMDNRFSVSSDDKRGLLSLYYRGPELQQPISVLSAPEVEQLVTRLGGEGAPGQQRLQFGYCDVVSLMQAMADQKRLSATNSAGELQSVAFVLQESPHLEQTIEEAPPIPETQETAIPSIDGNDVAASAAAASGMNATGGIK
jgi:hypothetical protein